MKTYFQSYHICYVQSNIHFKKFPQIINQKYFIISWQHLVLNQMINFISNLVYFNYIILVHDLYLTRNLQVLLFLCQKVKYITCIYDRVTNNYLVTQNFIGCQSTRKFTQLSKDNLKKKFIFQQKQKYDKHQRGY
eukprot:EC095579.1.p1 GENE.EC095579.1~~EC095579.1.p1  ORF type:complete len:135 (-),score=1.36 EC095579.1:200-604(-)